MGIMPRVQRRREVAPRCRRCHRKLTDERSIAQGMGETCKRKFLGIHPGAKIKAYLGPRQLKLPF